MRKFITKFMLLIFTLLLLLPVVYVVPTYLTANKNGLAHEVFYVLDKAQYNSGRPIVILGDSVCNQLWDQRQDSENITHLACNQAVTACGTWLLLRKYLENNPQTKEVYYVIVPKYGLCNELNTNYTYQYFVIPFINENSMQLIESETLKQLYNKFGQFFVENKYIKRFLLNDKLFMSRYIHYVNANSQENIHRLSRTGIIYLRKIQELCREHDIKLFVRPLPMLDIENNHGFEDFERNVKTFGFEDVLGDYVKRIKYYPDDWFRDKVHFTKEVLEAHGDEIRASILQQ